MRRTAIVVSAGLACLVALGVGLWLWERSRRPPTAKSSAERLLVGFDPNRLDRVQIQMGELRLDRRMKQGVWVPEAGSSDIGGPVRLGRILDRLAVLKAEPVSGEASDRSPQAAPAEDVARITVWRGGARPLVLRFLRQERRMAVHASDREGLYAVDQDVIRLLREELAEARQELALRIHQDRVVKVSLRRKNGAVVLVKEGGRWFVEDDGALAAADSGEVGLLLRMLVGLRVRQRLGQGPGARAPKGLKPPEVSVVVEDGTAHRLDLGGPCPSDPNGRVAGLGEKGEEVVCLGEVDESLLLASFMSLQLFGVTADEVRAAAVGRGRAVLAVEHDPARGGWQRVSPSAGEVDQTATGQWVAALTGLRGQKGSPEDSDAPDGVVAVGRITLTPLVGNPEAVELFAAVRGGEVRWARREAGGRWFALPKEAGPILTADPVSLLSVEVCTFGAEAVVAMGRNLGDGATEISIREGGIWQLVLLKGRKQLGEARKIASALERYRAQVKPSEHSLDMAWKAPVLLVEAGDAELRELLIHQVSTLRATRFVAGRASREHGFDGATVRVTAQYEVNCREEDGTRKCDLESCDVELGGADPRKECHARRPGDGAVFLLPGAVCEVLGRPTVSRQVSETPLDTLTEIHVVAGRARVRFRREEGGDWRSAEGGTGSEGGMGHSLLFLGPLVAEEVVGLDAGRPKDPALTATLRRPHVPPVVLRFYESEGKEGYEVVRGDRPVRYRVRPEPLRKLLSHLQDR